MRFYSTNDPKRTGVTLREATLRGIAEDGGLYMPQQLPCLPQAFYNNMAEMTIREVAYVVGRTMLGDALDPALLRDIIDQTFTFEVPLLRLDERSFVLELFHGPTLAFKDVGARFLAGVLRILAGTLDREIHVVVATAGDTGGAVARAFHDVPGTRVHVLYPAGRLTDTQRNQFASLGGNVEAIEVRGSFDQCQAMARAALCDPELRQRICVTSGNSLNVMRLLPQMFYYFHAVAQLQAQEPHAPQPVISIPCGNLGDLVAALAAQKMGLRVKALVAANNANDTTVRYLATGRYTPAPARATIAAAMDVAEPANIERIQSLFGGDLSAMARCVSGYSFNDGQISETMVDTFCSLNYLMEPHTATAYMGMRQYQQEHPGVPGIFLATAHPSKFAETIHEVTGADVALPNELSQLAHRPWHARRLAARYPVLKRHLMALA